MINLFQFAPNDQSLYYLSQIFGNVGSVLPVSGNASLLLSVMFKTFNSIILAVAVLVIVYITVVGVMKTAGEGEFLGKGWNSLWVPIRMVLGVAALVPSPSGYSGIQILMMWVIVQGIGAADTMWTTALNYISIAGSPYASVQIPYAGTAQGMSGLFQGLVCASTAYRRDANPSGVNETNGAYFCKQNPTDTFCSSSNQLYSLSQNSVCSDTTGICTMQMGPGIHGLSGACGTLTYCNQSTGSACADPTSLKCTACKAQTTALGQIVTGFGAIADSFSQADYDYRQFFSGGGAAPSWVSQYCTASSIDSKQCCPSLAIPLPPGLPPLPGNVCQLNLSVGPGNATDLANNVVTAMMWPYLLSNSATVNGANFLNVSISNYTQSIVNAVSQQISALVAQQGTQLPPQLQDARTTGWIFAGAYYYYIAQMNNNNLKDANPTFTVTPYNSQSPASDATNPLNTNRNNYNAANGLLNFLASAASGAGGFQSSTPPQMQQLSSSAFSAESGILSSFMSTVSGGGANGGTQDPLAAVQSLGESILLTIEILFSVLLILIFVLAMAGYIDVYVLGTGASDPLGPTLATLFLFLVPIILGFMGSFMGIGATLAVYVPLVPYMIFTFGVIGWFIATIEAMIAGPIIALGVMTPGGPHDVLGKAEPALYMIFGIFLRPTLMIFGMMAAMLLSAVVVTMVNASFQTVMLQITAYQLGNSSSLPGQTSGSGGGGVDLLELIFFMAAYVMLVVAVLNKSFSLIHVVPDGILRWIGHHGGEGGAPHLEEIKGGVSSAAGTTGGGARAAPMATGKAALTEKKEALKRREEGAGDLTEKKP